MRRAATTMPLTSVVTVDDHRAFSEALGMAVDLQQDLRLAGVATTGEEGLDLIAIEQPDVAIIDVMLPDADGIDVARRVHDVSPATRVVILTARADIAVMARAAAVGAAGFISKTRPVAEILATIRAAVEGEVSLDRSTLTALLARLEGDGAGRGPPQAQLTPRELEVLSLLGDGLSVHKMASRLQISVHTCRGSVKSILGKLGAHSQLEAVVKASRQGLLPNLR
jgi:DNA-binding NarL/FixJ family response regulator